MSESGILLLDKPVGLSSNAALSRAKRVLGIAKAGHTGTLDPLASGLLILCFGEATKVAGYLLDSDKAYLAEVCLGATTETDDAEGEIVQRRPVPEFDDAGIDAALARFRGRIEQVPPMYSALKQGGERLYRMARRGETVERPPRAVTIHELELISRDGERLRLGVHCSKGTYIRSLARDLGEMLGCGAHLSALRRTRSAPFDIAEAVTLDELLALDRASARSLLKPADQALVHLPAVLLSEELAARLLMGQRLADVENQASGLVRIYGPEIFLGVGEADGRGGLKPKRLISTAKR
ncbi:MAG: tRNA pseudouridine(55) synthase TruB [Wenzhouxiangella sp.]|nr:MAG: tRNA pseudouridine(55) synthase TruB [Wenzhouxiangella sp.]